MFHHLAGRHATPHQHPTGKIFSYLTFLSCTGDGAFLTIFPIVLLKYLGSEQLTSYYSAAIALVIFVAALGSSFLFACFSRIAVAKWGLGISALTMFGMSFVASIWHIAAFDIPRAAAVVLFNICLSLLLAAFFRKEELSKEEGRFFLFNNIGWTVGPIIGGILSSLGSYQSAFMFASLCYVATFVLFLHQHFIAKHPHLQHEPIDPRDHTTPWAHLTAFFARRDLFIVILISLGLNLWWSVGLYRSMQLHQMGFGDDIVGIISGLTSVPMVLLEGVIGSYADRYGIRRFIILGFVWLVVFSLLLCLFSQSSAYAFLITVVLAYIGAAAIEPLKDAYFFKSIEPSEHEKYFGVYNIAGPIAIITGPLLGVFFFNIGGYSGFWLGMAGLLLLFCIAALGMRRGV